MSRGSHSKDVSLIGCDPRIGTEVDQVACHASEAAAALGEALAAIQEPRQRECHRRLLDRAIDGATRALAAAAEERTRSQTADESLSRATTSARVTFVNAHAARAEDALHGAGQLSLSAQRAPTCEACEEGWQRVAAIVAVAESSARTAASIAGEAVEHAPRLARRVHAAVRRAEHAAHAARSLLAQRNHAYTFHTSGGFSFGEGWYLAAAGVLAGVSIQIEPGAGAAEIFLQQAGLGPLLRPYRSRPRAMKQVTDIVARAFRADPAAAQRRLRAAFLGDEPVGAMVRDWIDRRLAGVPRGKKVLLWIRDGAHHPGRNTRRAELVELTTRAVQAGLVPMWIGDAAPCGGIPGGVVDLCLFWKDAVFQGPDMRRAQLQFFEHLRAVHDLVGQVGVTTAGMDGPALMGLPTLYLTDAPNVRMRAWVGAVPEYREVVRGAEYLEEITRVLFRWAAGG